MGFCYAGNKQSLAVSFADMAQVMPNPAIWLADQPREMLQILHKAAKDVAREEYRELFENEEYMEVYVRVTELPIADSLRDIRHVHLNSCLKADFNDAATLLEKLLQLPSSSWSILRRRLASSDGC